MAAVRRRHAVTALRAALSVFVRLFAPFIPFATEETWSWFNSGSVHTAEWPVADDLISLAGPDADAGLLALVGSALVGVRGAKTTAKASQKTPVESAVVHAPAGDSERLRLAAEDLVAVGRISELRIEAADVDQVVVAEIRLETQPEAWSPLLFMNPLHSPFRDARSHFFSGSHTRGAVRRSPADV